jgi:hypothetical protein
MKGGYANGGRQSERGSRARRPGRVRARWGPCRRSTATSSACSTGRAKAQWGCRKPARISGYPSRFHAKTQLTITRRRRKLSPQCAVPLAWAASTSLNPSIASRHEIGGAIRGSRSAVTARAHGSTGRERPGSLPHSGVLSAGGVVLAEGSDLAQPPSDKDARWHDRAPAER